MILIRFNTKAKGPEDRWRVIDGDVEHLVAHFMVSTGCMMIDTESTDENGLPKYNVGVPDGRVTVVHESAYITRRIDNGL